MKAHSLIRALLLPLLTTLSACGGDLLEGAPDQGAEPVGAVEQAALRCPRSGAINVDTFRELLVVHPSVTGDARSSNATGGPWSFRFLVEQMTPVGVDPADFVEQWLRQFETVTSVNGFPVEPRPIQQAVLGPWPKRADGKLDLSRAPFRLMAIVNRMDLRSVKKPNGEGRFVFAVLGPPNFGGAQPLSFSVIFEFNLPTDAGQTSAVWAERWHNLGSVSFGTRYNTQLQALTDKFTKRGAMAAGVNGNAISQVRTNEIALSSPWELREFHLAPSGFLTQATVANNPDISMRSFETGGITHAPLLSWIQDPANRDAILAGTHSLPLDLSGSRALSDGLLWRAPELAEDEPLRAAFSKETCDGCHNGEVQQIDGFYHISPTTPPGATGQANVSEFMKSVDLPRRKAQFQTLMCPPAGVVKSADGTAAPPARNGKTH